MAGLELLSDQGYRVDGRRAGELRKIQARMGVFSQADGSAYIEQGNTKALAVVYGPHEASGRRGPDDLRGVGVGAAVARPKRGPGGDGPRAPPFTRHGLGAAAHPSGSQSPVMREVLPPLAAAPLSALLEASPRYRLQRLHRTSPDALTHRPSPVPYNRAAARTRPAFLHLSPQTPISFLFLTLSPH